MPCDDRRSSIEAEFVVWCEHEAATTVESSLGAAHWLHSIDVDATLRGAPKSRLNTDPWIWTDGFLWTICRRQKLAEQRVVDSLQTGDLVVFGSSIGGQWLMDTVLVVDKVLGGCGERTSQSYERCVLQPLDRFGLRKALRPVRGASFGEAETYSFAPVQTVRLGTAVGRINISADIADLVTRSGAPPSPSNARALVACTYARGAAAFWLRLVKATKAGGMELGVRFDHPLDAADYAVAGPAPARSKGGASMGVACASRAPCAAPRRGSHR